MINHIELEQIIWVASRVPVPPFTGVILKPLTGISALAKKYSVQVVTFAHASEMERTASAFSAYWGSNPNVHLNLVAPGKKPSVAESLLLRRFQFGLELERSSIHTVLDKLTWNSPNKLVLFDDIVFAPLLTRYGHNALISPHDCISAMFRCHYALVPLGIKKARLLTQYWIAHTYESRFYQSALVTHLITQRDRVLLEQINPFARYHVASIQIPNSPDYTAASSESWDILIWADLTIPAIANAVRQSLDLLRPYAQNGMRILLVGRAPSDQAHNILSQNSTLGFHYSRFIEDDQGAARRARVVLVPDLAGAGIKTRCLSTLANGLCLACLYSQMEGIERAADVGAINAFTLPALISKIIHILQANKEQEIANRGQTICRDLFNPEGIDHEWQQMLERAQVIKAK